MPGIPRRFLLGGGESDATMSSEVDANEKQSKAAAVIQSEGTAFEQETFWVRKFFFSCSQLMCWSVILALLLQEQKFVHPY